MANTAVGLPYPVGTDFVVDGDNAIRALAEAVDPYLPRAWVAMQPASGDWGSSPANPAQYRFVEDMVELRGVLTYNRVVSAGNEFIAMINVPAQALDNEGFQLVPMYGDGTIGQGNIAFIWVPADTGLRVRFGGGTTVGARVGLDGVKYRRKL